MERIWKRIGVKTLLAKQKETVSPT